MMPYKPGNRRHHMKYLAKRESRLLQSKYETYHYHRHFNKKIPHFGCLFDESGQPVYGIYSNTIVSVVETVRNMDVRRNLVHASLFGHPLIVDFSYYHLMLSKQFSSLATQTHLVFARNCKTKHPFDLFFTSYSRGHRFEDFFVERSGGYSPDQLMITLREEPLEKLFPLEKLIYLSPHSPDVMTHFDPDAIYVLGALVDTYRTDKTENSFLRASAANIRSVRLPVTVKERNDRPPCLTISAVANMLIDMRNEGISVEEAMNRHLSIRKMRAPLNVVLRQQRKLELESTFSQQVDKLMTDCLSVH